MGTKWHDYFSVYGHTVFGDIAAEDGLNEKFTFLQV